MRYFYLLAAMCNPHQVRTAAHTAQLPFRRQSSRPFLSFRTKARATHPLFPLHIHTSLKRLQHTGLPLITALICDVSQGMAVLGSLILPDLRHPARVKLCYGNLGLNLFYSGKRFFGVYPVSESVRRGLGYEMPGIKGPMTAPDITASGDTLAWLIGLGYSVAVMHLGLEQGDIRIQSFREISCHRYYHEYHGPTLASCLAFAVILKHYVSIYGTRWTTVGKLGWFKIVKG